MSQENVKPEQIQASVAAALSRLRGDVAPPSDAADNPPPPAPSAPSATPTGMAPGVAGLGVRSDPMRPPANDLRAEPGLRPVSSGSMPSGPGTAAPNEPSAAKEPELPRAMFSRPGPMTSASTPSASPTNTPMTGTPIASTPAQPAAEPAPTVQRPASPLSRMMARDAAPAEAPRPVTVEKTAAPIQQPDLLAGLPPPPLGDALTQEPDDGGARRRRNRRMLMLGAAIVIVAGAFWLFTRGGGDSADVPVITADATPEKVKPADEGGLQVPNQNVQVLDNTGQPAEGETVLPPPEQPVTPPEPAVAEATQAPEPPAVVESDNATVVEDVPALAAPEPEPATTAEAPAVPAPEPAAEAAQPAAAAPAAPAVAETTPEPAPAIPAQDIASAAEPAPAPAPEPAPAPVQEAAVTPPAPVAVGNTRVQLAAVKSEDNARAEWAKMQKAHPDLLGNLTLNIERVDKGSGNIFYRIQAGPLADRAAAKQLCASLKGQGQDCILAK